MNAIGGGVPGGPAPGSRNNDALALLRSAWAALQRGQPAQARSDCEAALRLVPESFDGWRMLAAARQALGDAPGCREALQQAHALRPHGQHAARGQHRLLE